MMSMIRFTVIMLSAFCIFFAVSTVWALTPEQVISLKNAGVSDQTIQLMIRQEQEGAAGSPSDSPGRKEITEKDGKTAIIYSTGRTAGNRQDKEDKQTEKAWEMLNSLIIDTRKSK